MKVLVTDGSYQNTWAIVRSLGRKNIDVSVLVSAKNGLSCLSRYCSHCVLSPPSSDESTFVDFLHSYLQKQQVSLLIPVGYKSVEAISKHKTELEKLTSIELPSHENVMIALNKKSTNQLVEKLGIPCPHTVYPISRQDINKLAPQITYPVVIKGICEAGARMVDYAFNQTELIEKYRNMYSTFNLSDSELPMIQEYIRGGGFGFFALYQRGVCKRVFMHRRIRENPPTGGASVCAESWYDKQLKEYGIKVLDALKWHGVAMVEFKLDEKDNQFKLLEINPKFWGSLDLAITAGVNFPYYLTRMSAGEEIEYSEEYKRNLRYQWPVEDFKQLKAKPSSLLPFLRDLFNPSVKSNIVIYDLKPFLMQLFRLFGTPVCRLFRKMSKR